jgi:TRAP-type C4-dicarboxylate transport system permease small subunit
MSLFSARSPSPFVGRLRASLTAVSVALLAAYFVLVLLQVFYRYVLNESLFWAEELVRGAMLWGIMLSSALVAASRGHIRVEVLELMLPPAGQRVVVWAANVLTLAFSLTLLWAGIQFVDRTWMQQSPVLDMPKWTVYLAIPVGAALESLLMILTWNTIPSPTNADARWHRLDAGAVFVFMALGMPIAYCMELARS